MTSATNMRSLNALAHSIALLQKAEGSHAEMKSIIEKCREKNTSFCVDEKSFTFTNVAAQRCNTAKEHKIEASLITSILDVEKHKPLKLNTDNKG